jgi:hypothetical protein
LLALIASARAELPIIVVVGVAVPRIALLFPAITLASIVLTRLPLARLHALLAISIAFAIIVRVKTATPIVL